MKQPLQIQIFDAEADGVFASFVEQGQTREEALASTERYFHALCDDTGPQSKPAQRSVKTLELASFFRFLKPFMKIPS